MISRRQAGVAGADNRNAWSRNSHDKSHSGDHEPGGLWIFVVSTDVKTWRLIHVFLAVIIHEPEGMANVLMLLNHAVELFFG
ncbi:hypothetical protein GCM10023116_40000 [Kistimonas scapharcae]|uniref:Uncharacterized protein n=1 Tax=Kistimonas scapharcae TaxID=1036133 RepID=A0ABP8V748_9GAMM